MTFSRDNRLFLTPGPAQFTAESAEHLATSFGRGDNKLEEQAKGVVEFLLELSGQSRLVYAQGSGTLANQIMIENFLYGRVLIVDSGYYSKRLLTLASSAEHVKEIEFSRYEASPSGQFDWVLATPVETGQGTLRSIVELRALADNLGARLALDGVASVGLEADHDLADVVGFSSCKGIFALTGACFLASKDEPANRSSSFYLDYDTHAQKKVTGPYSQIQSIIGLRDMHSEMVACVEENKALIGSIFSENIVHDPDRQPLISTAVRGAVIAPFPLVEYQPREKEEGISVISTLGYLGHSQSDSNPYGELFSQKIGRNA